MSEPIYFEASMHGMMTRRQALLTGCAFLGSFVLGACSRGQAQQSTTLHYTVRSGDTLSKLSRRSGLSISEIVQANRLRTNTLEIGQTLQFPGVFELGPDPLALAPSVPTKYKLISRAEWGALPTKSNSDPMTSITRMTVHHTHEIPGMMQRSDSEIVNAIARYHRNTLQWADIGYHYLIGRDGFIYEGRPATTQGAHARGINNLNNLGIAVIGDFNSQLPEPKQLQALEQFLDAMRMKYNISKDKIYGHYQFVNTECPGVQLKSWLTRYVAKS